MQVNLENPRNAQETRGSLFRKHNHSKTLQFYGSCNSAIDPNVDYGPAIYCMRTIIYMRALFVKTGFQCDCCGAVFHQVRCSDASRPRGPTASCHALFTFNKIVRNKRNHCVQQNDVSLYRNVCRMNLEYCLQLSSYLNYI